MTAPRAREQTCPPSPPDRLPPRRGGRPSSETYSAAGRPAVLERLRVARRSLVGSARALAAAALLALTGAFALPASAQTLPAAPTNFSAEVLSFDAKGIPSTGRVTTWPPARDARAVRDTHCGPWVDLTWDPHDTDPSTLTKHQYQIANAALHATLANPTVAPWPEVDHVDIPDSGPAGSHYGSYRVTSYQGECLERGVTYYFTIRAVLGEELGPSVGPINVTTFAVPEAPELTATPGYGQIVLNWTVPDDGGQAIWGYRIMTNTEGLGPDGLGAPWEVLATFPASTTSYTHTGLGEGVTRYYWVQAANRIGLGPFSEPARTTTLAPVTVTSVVVASAPQSGDTYRSYETIVFTVTFSEPVEVKPHGRLRLKVGLDNPGGASGSTVEAVFSGLSQSQRPTADTPQARLARHMHFEYKVQLFDRDENGVRIGANALRLASGARIRSEGGRDAELDHAAVGTLSDHKVDGSADVPMIRRIEVVSTPRLSSKGTTNRDTYGEGENIRIEVRFDQPVVVEGEPTFALEVGNPCLAVCEADYESGSGTDTLVFAYLVLEVDIDRNGIAIRGNPIEVVSGDSIRNAADQEAHLSSKGKGTQRGHKVDGSRAAGSHLSVEDAAAREGETLRFTMELAQAAKAPVTVDYETADGTATAGEDYEAKRGTVRFAPGGTRKTVEVAVLRDEETEDAETVVLRLSNARSEGSEDPVEVTDPEAEGTIEDVAPEASGELTASFDGMPAAYDGESGFRFRVAFSEDIGISFKALREDAFTVTGGRVTGGKRVDDRRDLFEMTVRPESDDDVTITLQAGRECAVSGAICTKGKNRRKLTNTITATVAGPPDERTTNRPATGAPTIGGTPQVGEELTASTSGIADADGLDDARFAYQWLRNDTDIQGATAPTYTAVDADAGNRLKVRVGFTDDAGNEESLASAATDAVVPEPEPLTASFSSMPSEHRGDGTFSFRVAFSDEIKISYKTMRDTSFTVTNGDISGARRVNGRRDLWEMTVEPDSDQTVTIRLPETHDCGASGAVCTGDGRPLSHSLSATVAGPVGILVADARVEEAEGALLAFAVTLSRAAVERLTVDYATANGSATAGDDYTAASGTLTFQAGETSKTIEVTVLDDAHDEGEETMTLTLSNASRGRVTDGEATGTIKNRDPLPRALLARFGRTAAVHVVEHVEERLAAPREPGFRGRFAGRELRRGMERDMALSFLSQLGPSAGAHPLGGGGPLGGSPAGGMGSLGTPGRAAGTPMAAAAGSMMGVVSGLGATAGPLGGAAGPDGGFTGGGLLQMGLGGGDLLTGSAFAMNRETRHGGILSFWSRGAQSHFAGREGALSLGGDVRTTMVGADYAKGPLVAGLSLSHSRGLGEYAGVAGGQVASSVTGLYPWLGYKATDRITVWGVAGYGAGGLRLTPQGGPALEAGLSMAMAAAGTRGELVAGGAGGFALAFKADALWVGTATDGVDGPAGRLAATEAAVTRFRTGLEGSRAYTLAGRLSLKPSVEVGLRHDGGDAETGAGMDVGVGLVVSDAATGLAVDVRVRTLLVHQAEGFSERGVAVSLSYNPTPSTPLGLTARVAPSWGGQAQSGAEALWGRETMAGMAHGGLAQGNRFDGEVGYGLPVGSRLVGTPRVGFSTSEYGRDYRVGYGLGVLDRENLNVELGVDAQRRESPMLGGTSNGVLGRASLGW